MNTPFDRLGKIDNLWHEKWARVVDAIHRMRTLQDNWDGQGAAAPSAEIVQGAVDLAEILSRSGDCPPTRAVATPAGTVLFGWDGPAYFEVEVLGPYRAEWMFIDKDGSVRHGGIPGDSSYKLDLISRASPN